MFIIFTSPKPGGDQRSIVLTVSVCMCVCVCVCLECQRFTVITYLYYTHHLFNINACAYTGTSVHHLACWSMHACYSGWMFGGEVGGGEHTNFFNYLFHIYFNAISNNFENKFIGGSNVPIDSNLT